MAEIPDRDPDGETAIHTTTNASLFEDLGPAHDALKASLSEIMAVKPEGTPDEVIDPVGDILHAMARDLIKGLAQRGWRLTQVRDN